MVDSEDISYSENVDGSKNSLDCLCVFSLDKCSWNIDSSENYNCHFVIESHKNIDSHFLYDCSNCQNCCLSSNLRNKSYVFKNKQLKKDEYLAEIEKLSLNTFSGFGDAKKEFLLIKENAISKYAKNINSINVTGDHIINSKDVSYSFDITKSENVSNGHRMIYCSDMKDCNWVLKGESEYETISGSGNSSFHVGCAVCFSSTQMEYSLFCRNCSNCFGCVGLKNAEHCILNKQYSKEEYFNLLPELRQHMSDLPYIDSKNRIYKYGEYFPYEMSPFGYNEACGHDYFPKTKEEATLEGFNWKDGDTKNYQTTKNSTNLPNSIEDVSDDILKDIIECPNKGDYMTQCTAAFKITPEELQFYRENNLPLPRHCPNCRHYERLSYRNPMHLYKRACNNRCGRTFETSYDPDRPEKVYCEQCYQAEVL